jgi:alpha-L-rhamnosidase
MKLRTAILGLLMTLLACCPGVCRAALSTAAEDLAAGFVSPPASAKPWVYWFWLNGNITSNGITADLEAMQRVGVGGVLIMEVEQGTPIGTVPFAGPEWRQLFKHVAAEARRLGLDVNMNNDAGDCGSGGPWITPELTMQRVVWSETLVTGPRHFEEQLSQPKATANAYVTNFYRDIATLAFPVPAGETTPAAKAAFKLQASVPVTNAHSVVLPVPGAGNAPYFQLEFAKPFTARFLSFYLGGSHRVGFSGEVQASSDGKNFETLRRFDTHPRNVSVSFAETTARYFRVVFTAVRHGQPENLPIGQIELDSRLRIDQLQEKAAFVRQEVLPQAAYPAVPHELTTARDTIVNLTAKMDSNGRLTWEVPPGKWIIARFGHTPTGMFNHPAPQSGAGLECDKLSKAGAEAMFNGLMAKLIADSKPLAGKTLVATHIDSWEVGSQNWTPGFHKEFARRRGYDLLPFLPVMTGRVVDNLEVSERFLWDLRQTISELVVENYAGHFRRLAHRHGLRLSIEAYYGCCDDMTYAGQADEPMGEFWFQPYGAGADWCNEMTSAAHIYGKRIVGAEAFTASNQEKWQAHPAVMKALGDWAFCDGINRLVFHRYALQPWNDAKPGMCYGPWGVHYERTQTWWEQSSAWHRYLGRCQYLLQQGLFVADVCYLEPEAPPHKFHGPVIPGPLPDRPAWNFDGCTPDAVLTRMTVKEGRLVLPDGMSYRVLVLPKEQTMTPVLLRKIRDLVAAGATVVGLPPLKSPSLTSYPACDEEIEKLVRELWGSGVPPVELAEDPFKKGRVIWGKELAAGNPAGAVEWNRFEQHDPAAVELYPAARVITRVMEKMNTPPDFDCGQPGQPRIYRYIHKQIGATDIYFVANKNAQPQQALCDFRVVGRAPELWWPDTGRIERIAVYNQLGGRTRLPLHLGSHGSVFVVFRAGEQIEASRVTSISRDGEQVINLNGKDQELSAQAKTTTDAIVARSSSGALEARVARPGAYTLTSADDKQLRFEVVSLPQPTTIAGPWEVRFAPGLGAPEQTTFQKLVSWSEHSDPGIKYFSGSAVYRKTFQWHPPPAISHQSSVITLDLGRVEVMASVTLNGKDLGILWKTPYQVEVTDALKTGENTLEITVVNLLINRQIGDEELPEDSDRNPNSSLKQWPQWLQQGKPSPTGRFTFSSWRLWPKGAPLVESGLLGPVELRAATKVVVE